MLDETKGPEPRAGQAEHAVSLPDVLRTTRERVRDVILRRHRDHDGLDRAPDRERRR